MQDSLLRYYFSTRVACVLLQVIRGATVRLPRVWGEVGYKIWTMCLPFASLSRNHFPLYLHTCTLIRGCVSDFLNLFHRHDQSSHQAYHLIPIAQTSLLNSTFPSPTVTPASR
jgi:hypothetical protein